MTKLTCWLLGVAFIMLWLALFLWLLALLLPLA